MDVQQENAYREFVTPPQLRPNALMSSVCEAVE